MFPDLTRFMHYQLNPNLKLPSIQSALCTEPYRFYTLSL
ncbi:hypothetical protein SAMN05444412_104324 [Rhodonellum ikkaensis]|uniref:Uncharacterized protein n=1 Tax=Rhodonellum ikkaensis TaxID=336829 RepID=A0A1H3PLI1_9BACT|nr:hypothetical protein SAMN05444412_104324 [Rhodonellum ikkaensis]